MSTTTLAKDDETMTAGDATVINFAATVGDGFDPEPEDNVYDSLFAQYEQVIFRSIITSFGLDFIVKDQHGGDVDTIHNVRSGVDYKSAANKAAYENRGDYNHGVAYRSDRRFADKKHNARASGQPIEDAYTGNKIGFLGKSKGAPPNKNAELDHVISAKEIHNDRGRVLSGLNGVDLANSDENLQFTNKSLNASLGDKKKSDYVEQHPELSAETKEKLLKHDKIARKNYEAKINMAYYTSPKFLKDTSIAAAKVGGAMALRQALGFVMTEVWFAVKDALSKAADGFAEKLRAIAEGIKRGFERAKDKFKELLAKFGEGAVAGIISSLVTTLCNIFFTTAKNFVRVIRQTWASIVEAAKILLFNPDNLPFSERMRAALKILATGASVVVGTFVQEAVHKALTPHIGAIPHFGETLTTVVSVFAGSLCTGFLTITLLYYIDSDPFGGALARAIDKTTANYKRQAKLFAEYAAKLAELDLETFEREAEMYHDLASQLETAKDNDELNSLLKNAIKTLGIESPWGEGSLEDFMQDPNTKLCFNA